MEGLKSAAVMDDRMEYLRNKSDCETDETRMVAEFLRIKAILDKNRDECDSVLFDSLSKLQRMVASVKILEVTGIGKSARVFQNHVSKDIREIARTIIKDWRSVVDEWMNDIFVVLEEEEVGEQKKNSVRISKQQRPLLVRIKLKKREVNSGKESVLKGPVTPEQKVQNSNGVDEVLRIKDILEKSRHESQSDSVLCDSLKKLQDMGLCVKTLEETGIGKTVRVLQKHESEDICETARTLVKEWKGMVEEWIKKDESSVVKATFEQVKPKSLNTERKIQVNLENGKDASGIEERLEATKRKLQQNYLEADMKKKKRRIQVMELHELTNQGLIPSKSGAIKKMVK